MVLLHAGASPGRPEKIWPHFAALAERLLAVYEQTVGLVLPRRANEQAAATQSIDRADLQPGDLVFFKTMRRTFSHVGIYIGDGKFIHAPSTGKTVRVDDLRAAYWTKRFTGARRVQDTAPADNANR